MFNFKIAPVSVGGIPAHFWLALVHGQLVHLLEHPSNRDRQTRDRQTTGAPVVYW